MSLSPDQQAHTIINDFITPQCDDFVEILYQDSDILLINKPSGLFQSIREESTQLAFSSFP